MSAPVLNTLRLPGREWPAIDTDERKVWQRDIKNTLLENGIRDNFRIPPTIPIAAYPCGQSTIPAINLYDDGELERLFKEADSHLIYSPPQSPLKERGLEFVQIPLQAGKERGLQVYDPSVSFQANMSSHWDVSNGSSHMTFVPPDCSNFTGQLQQVVYNNHTIDDESIRELHAYLSSSTPSQHTVSLLSGQRLNLDDTLTVECDSALMNAAGTIVHASRAQHHFHDLSAPLH